VKINEMPNLLLLQEVKVILPVFSILHFSLDLDKILYMRCPKKFTALYLRA